MIAQAKQGQFLHVATKLLERFVYNQEKKHDVLAMFLEVGAEVFIREEEAMMNHPSYLPYLPQISCQTMVIHGREDQNFSLQLHEEITRLIPHAKLAIVENAGHMSPMETPEAVTSLMQLWLMDAQNTGSEGRLG